MPNSLQYPLERQRDLQRKWDRLFQRAVTRSARAPSELFTSFGCSNQIAPIELEAFGDRAGRVIAASSSYQPVGAAARARTRPPGRKHGAAIWLSDRKLSQR